MTDLSRRRESSTPTTVRRPPGTDHDHHDAAVGLVGRLTKYPRSACPEASECGPHTGQWGTVSDAHREIASLEVRYIGHTGSRSVWHCCIKRDRRRFCFWQRSGWMPESGISCIYRAFQYKNLGAFCTANWPARPNATVPAKFNQRAQWRMVRHAGPDGDGVTRWRCPFCAGLLRSRQVPKTMRRSRRAPLVELPDGVDSCCAGILSAAPVELALSQRIPYGTTAWRISMGRRQIVESANSALKGAFVDLGRGFFRVFGQVKMTVLLGFTVAGFNLDRIRSFRAKQEERESAPRQRAKRRMGTWGDQVAAPGAVVPAEAASSPD